MLRTLTSASFAGLLVTTLGAGAPAAQSREPMTLPGPVLQVPPQGLPEGLPQAPPQGVIDLQLDFDSLAADFDDVGNELYAALSARLQSSRPPVTRRDPRPLVVVRAERDADGAYRSGTRALDSGRWEQAIQQFQRVIEVGGARVDGAMYWIAWAQSKQGNSAAALESLTRLRQSYPNSRWVAEARALEVEIRQAAGQPVRPEVVADDELKLMALNSLVRMEDQRAIPMLDKILKGTGPPKLKERALFVLAQNGSAKARQMVTDIAKGAGNPDLQVKAVNYLGVFGGAETRQTLVEIYKTSTSVEVKRSIIRASVPSRDRERLLEIAKTEQAAELRAEAVQQLGALGAQDELLQLYQTDVSPDVRRRIVQAMFAGHNPDRLIRLLKIETDEALRRSIVQNLGQMGSAQGTDALVSLYGTEKDDAVRRAIIDAFSNERNVKVLIDLARKEMDPNLKKRIFERLSSVKSSEATDYFLELLSKP
jgi:HEAT repeat protein